jgi:3-oxoacyl-[acyl-carrier protein] reductase
VQKAVSDSLSAVPSYLHILINNTGGPAGGPLIDAKPEEFIQTFHNHLLNNHALAQAGYASHETALAMDELSTLFQRP